MTIYYRLRDANGNALEEKTHIEKELDRLRNENGELLRMGKYSLTLTIIFLLHNYRRVMEEKK